MALIPERFDKVSIVEGGSELPDSVTLKAELMGKPTQFTIAGIQPDKTVVPEKVPENEHWTVTVTTVDGAPIQMTLKALATTYM